MFKHGPFEVAIIVAHNFFYFIYFVNLLKVVFAYKQVLKYNSMYNKPTKSFTYSGLVVTHTPRIGTSPLYIIFNGY